MQFFKKNVSILKMYTPLEPAYRYGIFAIKSAIAY
jgi:hypothetical protein